MEAEMQDPYDPATDPEEQKLILSVLDSFRYIPTCLANMKSKFRTLTLQQLLSPSRSLQWHTPPSTRLLFPPTSPLDTAISTAFLHPVYPLPSR
jgi:hypothetical protein